MRKNFKNKVFITFIVIIIISIIVFASISFINWSLLTGFIIGTIISILNYYITKFYSTSLLSKRRSFKLSFFVGIMKSIIFFSLVAGTFIGILFANKQLNDSWINGTFNVFTFICGCISVPLSIISWNFIDMVKSRKKRKQNINN